MSIGRGILAVASSILLLCTSTWVAQAQQVQQHILILYPSDAGLPATTAIASAARQRLTEFGKNKFEIYSEFLDAVRFPGPQHDDGFARYLSEKYASTPLHAIIAIGPESLRFISRRRETIAPDVPIVYCGLTRHTVAESGPLPKAAGIVDEFDLSRTLRLAERLQPDARRIVLVNGAANFDKSWEESARVQLEPYRGRFTIDYFSALPKQQMIEQVSALRPDTIVVFTSFFMDGAGQRFVPRDVVGEAAWSAGAPIYAPYDSYFGRGIVGG